MAKLSLSSLPLPTQLLIHRLTPDFPLRSRLTSPSLQRRARLLPASSHFSFVNPFPVAFPYDIEPPGPDDPPVTDKNAYIEDWLSAREATNQRPANTTLRIFDPNPSLRDQPRILLGLSPSALRDCLPHLDIGTDDPADPARNELIDILSGHSVLATPPDSDSPAFAPWSLRYSGHQFGSWAGQLGDGRAISILVTPHPTDPTQTIELQLKGAGRTPFSRTADGLAVLRSSIREYLCSEAMHALNIPTTRALSLISLPRLPVSRERLESACVLTRIAPSFIRIGSFEALNGPTNLFFFGGGQQDPDLDALRLLGEWVVRDVLRLDVKEGEMWGRELVMEVARRNARMVAGWQAYGFMHGVINTDNVSILGLTIDYGPYAFMDVFDPLHICNHTDEGGRYAYAYQPNMIIYALRALLTSLAPLIGAELSLGHAVSPGWASTASKETLEVWRSTGLELRAEMERIMQEECSTEYALLMRQRLGLLTPSPHDESTLFAPLLRIMQDQRLDFHRTFRTLCFFRPSWILSPSPELEKFLKRLLGSTDTPSQDHARGAREWMEWLGAYAERIRGEEGGDEERTNAMRGVNPRFVLRQWVLEEVIGRVEGSLEGKVEEGRKVLGKVMHMASNPYEGWGAEELGDEEFDAEGAGEEVREERRLCGMGEKKMLGFQCSCSS